MSIILRRFKAFHCDHKCYTVLQTIRTDTEEHAVQTVEIIWLRARPGEEPPATVRETAKAFAAEVFE